MPRGSYGDLVVVDVVVALVVFVVFAVVDNDCILIVMEAIRGGSNLHAKHRVSCSRL